MPLRIFRILFQSVFVIANLLVVILFIAAAYSDRVAPEEHIIFSYLGLGFPILCLLNLFFVFYWAFLLEWKLIWISILSFVICWVPVRNYFPFHSRVNPELEGKEVLKVLSYNVMAFAYKNHTSEDPNSILQYIIDSGADIVCLQEYCVHSSDKYLTEKKVNQALKMYPYRSIIPFKKSASQVMGLAVYSKYPISKSRQIKYDSQNNGSSIHEVDINGKKVTLINNHLESFKLTMDDKNTYSEFIKSGGSDLLDDLKGTIQQKLGPAFVKRGEQARIVAEEIKNAKTDYVFVCGDFNDTPISYAHRTVQGNLVDAFSKSGRGLGVTYNENFFLFRIDHIMCSSNIQPFNCTVDKVKYSDHYPIWSYFSFKE